MVASTRAQIDFERANEASRSAGTGFFETAENPAVRVEDLGAEHRPSKSDTPVVHHLITLQSGHTQRPARIGMSYRPISRKYLPWGYQRAGCNVVQFLEGCKVPQFLQSHTCACAELLLLLLLRLYAAV
jgi:hypothetical protein